MGGEDEITEHWDDNFLVQERTTSGSATTTGVVPTLRRKLLMIMTNGTIHNDPQARYF
ncbi:unnamed protein product [Amoebophrya sp. A120]|nr:unnamed protein product [Amoebophrya sp. A120]|eukprot:GSA120T00016223001.1